MGKLNLIMKKNIVVISPIFIIIICQLIPFIWGKDLETRIFIPILLTYWMLIAALVFFYGRKSIKKWLGKPKGHWIWAILLILLGLVNLPFFLLNISVLGNISLLIPHILFFLINPWLEEFYWRGLLIDKTNNWPPWVANLYSTILFTIYHTSYAWHAKLFRGIPFYAFILITAVIMVLSYQRTKSLWWGIICHFLTNIFTLSIPVLYNMIEI
jgi:membrane protease YdiL (CAAX protease family)